MRVLLRDATTGLYFQEPENWTTETEKAQTFKHSAEAMNRAREKRVQHAEVVLAFEEPGYTVALPLP
jgi:stress response protein YsnF